MREIKFRAWALDHEAKGLKYHMYYNVGILPRGDGAKWEYIVRTSSHGPHEDQWFNFDVKLMQYTGLKDKNGKEIYEGDIVLSFGNKEVIEWKEASNHENGFWSGYNLNAESADIYEIIGNLYENPELLTS